METFSMLGSGSPLRVIRGLKILVTLVVQVAILCHLPKHFTCSET
jgi:hypothetical protein